MKNAAEDIAELKIDIDLENKAMYRAVIERRFDDAAKHAIEIERLGYKCRCVCAVFHEERNRCRRLTCNKYPN